MELIFLHTLSAEEQSDAATKRPAARGRLERLYYYYYYYYIIIIIIFIIIIIAISLIVITMRPAAKRPQEAGYCKTIQSLLSVVDIIEPRHILYML